MRLAVFVAAIAALLGVAGVGLAQETPPTVTVTASPTALTVGVTSPAESGPTRFDVTKSGGREQELTFGALRAGVTVDQFTATLRTNPDAAIEQVHIDSGVALGAGEERRAVTFTLRANTTYVVVNGSDGPPSSWEVASFTVGGTANGATAPVADANVRIIDLRFRGARTLPRDGVIRFTNAGWAPHFAVAAPFRRGVETRRVRRALRENDERALNRLLNFERGIEPQGLITRGAVNFNEVRFPRRGRHVMFCFFDGHADQGMWRIIRVE